MKIALGAAQFGSAYGVANETGQVHLAEAAAIVEHARARGADTIDTAVSYGASEQVLGSIGVRGWRVVSKLPRIPVGSGGIKSWVRTEVEGSLSRLGIERLHGLLLHRPDQLLSAAGCEIYDALEALRASGAVAHIGVSVYNPTELDALSAFRFGIVQAPFSPVDQRLATSGWMTRLAEQGTELHVRSIFLQGLLLMSADRRPPLFDRWNAVWRSFEQWCAAEQLSPVDACVRHAHAFDGIARVVVGVESSSQLTAILDAAARPAIRVPLELASDDPDLLNPSRWSAIA